MQKISIICAGVDCTLFRRVTQEFALVDTGISCSGKRFAIEAIGMPPLAHHRSVWNTPRETRRISQIISSSLGRWMLWHVRLVKRLLHICKHYYRIYYNNNRRNAICVQRRQYNGMCLRVCSTKLV